jgi:hypothetical protein
MDDPASGITLQELHVHGQSSVRYNFTGAPRPWTIQRPV